MTISKIVIPGDPVPAARPKVYRSGTTYPKRYQMYRVAGHSWAEKQPWVICLGPLRVTTSFVTRKPRTSKLTHPIGDVDNYAKAVLDILNKRAWNDDVQIIDLKATKRFARPDEEPHTVVTIEPLGE
jgi:Holliday junction resolvase RusA-like endonuclease